MALPPLLIPFAIYITFQESPAIPLPSDCYQVRTELMNLAIAEDKHFGANGEYYYGELPSDKLPEYKPMAGVATEIVLADDKHFAAMAYQPKCYHFPGLPNVLAWSSEDEWLKPPKDGGKSKRELLFLAWAAEGNLASINQYIANKSFNTNSPNIYGRTALMLAAQKGNAGVVTALLAGGANKSVKTETGKTARDLAREAGREQIADILK